METGTMWRETSALLCAAIFLVAGCSKKGDAGENAAGSDPSIGVAECDEYIKKMDAFLADLPEEARSARAKGFQAMRDAWREAAKTPAGKDSLKATCKAQLDTIGATAPAK
ncbi:hypothetical protein [Polyangium aurulentum]|uniref:hypothetical protein n=1 Tax=Polyangium aurulentum TaxID=2567896 RepID=UPI0010ADCE35|nr:hypothetical protein [Polyangium aurulentum]UQA62361.1 hypothetical protein E8A73_018615 [Polyangium aurulentum]